MRGEMRNIQASAAVVRGDWVAWVEDRRWAVVALYLALTAIALYPVLSVTVLPLVDYPNHLARMYILANLATDPALQRNFSIDWSLNPNMAMDLIVPAAARVMSIYSAGKLFVAAVMLLILGSTLALRKVLVGRVGLWPVLTFLLLYNHALFWGFLNYLFTAGLALFAFAGWIVCRERDVWLRTGLFTVAAFVLYVGHLFGLLIFALLVAGYELWRIRACPRSTAVWMRQSTAMIVPFIPPFVLFIAWAADNKSVAPAITRYGSISEKFAALTSPANVGLPFVDIPTVVFLVFVVIACWRISSIRLISAAKLPLLLMTVVAVAMPGYLVGVWGTDLRLPVIVGCLLIASTEFSVGSERPKLLLVSIAVIAFAVRAVAVSGSWHDIDGDFAEFRMKARTFETGASLLVVEDADDRPSGKPPVYMHQYAHMGALVVIKRSAFVSTLFTGHTAIRASSTRQVIDSPVGNPITRQMLIANRVPKSSHLTPDRHHTRYFRAYWSDWPETFDYVLSIRFGNTINPAPHALTLVDSGSFFDIYRVKPTAGR
jgi:hypothetical protein